MEGHASWVVVVLVVVVVLAVVPIVSDGGVGVGGGSGSGGCRVVDVVKLSFWSHRLSFHPTPTSTTVSSSSIIFR